MNFPIVYSDFGARCQSKQLLSVSPPPVPFGGRVGDIVVQRGKYEKEQRAVDVILDASTTFRVEVRTVAILGQAVCTFTHPPTTSS